MTVCLRILANTWKCCVWDGALEGLCNQTHPTSCWKTGANYTKWCPFTSIRVFQNANSQLPPRLKIGGTVCVLLLCAFTKKWDRFYTRQSRWCWFTGTAGGTHRSLLPQDLHWPYPYAKHYQSQHTGQQFAAFCGHVFGAGEEVWLEVNTEKININRCSCLDTGKCKAKLCLRTGNELFQHNESEKLKLY